jgi:hypothetical protein
LVQQCCRRQQRTRSYTSEQPPSSHA